MGASTDCLGLKQDTRHGLSQLQMNVLAGVIFSGCSFLTDITAAPSRSSGRAFAPALWGAVAYLLLGLLPVHLQESWASQFPNAAARAARGQPGAACDLHLEVHHR